MALSSISVFDDSKGAAAGPEISDFRPPPAALALPAGTTAEPGSLAGFSGGGVKTNVIHDFAKRQLSVLEQDQRTPQTVMHAW